MRGRCRQRREHGKLSSPRSRSFKAFAYAAKWNLASMLPGFRFLFAAIILSMSILSFGLGAAALLRTAHEAFASAPTWQPAPETRFAQAGDATKEANRPVLALLRVDDAPKAEQTASATAAVTAPAEPAALPPQDSSLAEASKPETPVTESSVSENPVAANPVAENPVTASSASESVAPAAAENPPQAEAAPAPADTPAPADETKVAATEAAAPTANEAIPVVAAPVVAAEAAPAAPERASVPTPPSPGVGGALKTVATLGGPAVTVTAPPPANPAVAKPDKSALKKKRLQTQRANARRKAAARAAQQASQPPLDLFGQPMRTR
jgi:hypothetical protein